jgi:hypothetical protein
MEGKYSFRFFSYMVQIKCQQMSQVVRCSIYPFVNVEILLFLIFVGLKPTQIDDETVQVSMNSNTCDLYLYVIIIIAHFYRHYFDVGSVK